MKKLLPSYILSFVICFMFFIFEPITMYSGNIDDLWFDFSMMIFPLIKLFLITFISLSLFYTIIYFIFCKKLNKYKIYYILLIISFILFIVSYIQGNYLSGNLPVLDGDEIIWSNYNNESLKSFALLLFVVAITIASIVKIGYEKFLKVIKYISLVIFGMLFVSLITTFITTKTLEYHKKTFALTLDNFNNVSTDKNFFIFLVDAVDSRVFNELIYYGKDKDIFDDFTYYPDTMAAYPYTRDSIPFILSGIINENEKDFSDYSTYAFNQSSLFNRLKELNYDINLYDDDLIWNSNKIEIISNVKNIKNSVDAYSFYEQEIKFILYKYLPYYLKKYSSINTIDFKKCQIKEDVDYFDWTNSKVYDLFKNNEIVKIDKKYFNYIHIEGGHVPFDIDEFFNYKANGSYQEKLLASLKVIIAFLNKLKDNNLYDNSVIIIMSDHGFNVDEYESTNKRQNPILYIKGIDEHHEMYTSDKPISYFDLLDAYNDLLDGKKSDELFKEINYNRERRYIWYNWIYKDHMVEYIQIGKAWDMDTLVKTGREFDR